MKKQRKQELMILMIAGCIGIVTGLVVSFYRYIIHAIEHEFLHVSALLKENPIFYVGLFFVLVLLGVIVGKMNVYEPLAGGSGIPQVNAELTGAIDPHPLKVLFVKIVGGILSALSGMSIGREGPSIQMGAMVGKQISKQFKQNKTLERFLLTSGASAGLAAAFNAPLAGVLFALEEVHRYFNRKLVLAIFTAAVIADYVSKIFFGVHPVFQFKINEVFPVNKYYLLIIFGIFLAIFGILYFKLMQFFQQLNDKIQSKYKTILYFITPMIFFIFLPDLLGGGSNLFKHLSNYSTIQLLFGVFILKLVFSIFSFSSKVPGGIFFPILILGAILGVIYSKMIGNQYVTLFLIFGMAGYLTAIVRAPITSVVLLLEMSGNISYILPLSVVCFVAYIVMNYLDIDPIYEYLLERLLHKKHPVNPKKEMIEVQMIIQEESRACNEKIKDLQFPKHCIIIHIEHQLVQSIVNGDTVLYAGDIVTMMVDEYNYSEVYKELEKLFIEKH